MTCLAMSLSGVAQSVHEYNKIFDDLEQSLHQGNVFALRDLGTFLDKPNAQYEARCILLENTDRKSVV